MSDRRLTPANGRVAAEDLRGMVTANRYVTGEAASIAAPVADLFDLAKFNAGKHSDALAAVTEAAPTLIRPPTSVPSMVKKRLLLPEIGLS